MKIVVVYATAGAGHKKAAQAIESYLRQPATPALISALVDIVAHSSWVFRLLYLWGYDFLINHCQWLWAVVVLRVEPAGIGRSF